MADLEANIKKIEMEQDEFNRNAALVPESDPNLQKLNEELLVKQDLIAKLSQSKEEVMKVFRQVKDQRVSLFTSF